MGDDKAHSSRSCLSIELRLVEREDLLVKNDEVDRHIMCKKETLDGIDGNLEGLLFWIAKDAGGDQGEGNRLASIFFGQLERGLIAGDQLVMLPVLSAVPAWADGVDHILAG